MQERNWNVSSDSVTLHLNPWCLSVAHLELNLEPEAIKNVTRIPKFPNVKVFNIRQSRNDFLKEQFT